MEQAVFGPISGSSRTTAGISRYAWLIRDRSGRPHTVAISASPIGLGLTGLLAPLLGRRLGGRLSARGRSVLHVYIDGRTRSRSMLRPGWPDAAAASEAFALDDGTELRVYAESPDGGRTVRCDLYVDDRAEWNPVDAAAPIEARVAAARMSWAAWGTHVARWLTALAGALLVIAGIARGTELWPMIDAVVRGLVLFVPVCIVVMSIGALASRGRGPRFTEWTAVATLVLLLVIGLAMLVAGVAPHIGR